MPFHSKGHAIHFLKSNTNLGRWTFVLFVSPLLAKKRLHMICNAFLIEINFWDGTF